MTSSSEQMYVISKPKWTWHKVSSELHTKLDGKISSFSLQPTIKLEDAQPASQNGKLKLQLSVDTQKSLQFDDSIGWNWHKSSNLPIISLKAQLQNSVNSNIIYPLPESFQARIFAVKILVSHLERQKVSHFEDVGLRGEDKIDMSAGTGFFDGIRFKTTSYINEGVKFHLLVLFYIQDGKQNSEFRNIISAVISPGIFVDSRKSARDHFEKRLISFTQIFSPQLLRKEFFKKSFKDRTTQYETKIANNLEGLYNYLTAPNIRHKVKHPFFLSVKFSNVFHIYFNSALPIFKQANNQESGFNPKLQAVMLALQRTLIIEGGKTRQKDLNYKMPDRMFLISITGPISITKRTKIYECLEFLNCSAVELVKFNSQIGPNYKNIFQLTDLVQIYEQLHDQLKQCTKRDMEIRRKMEQKSKGDWVDVKYSYQTEKIEKSLKKVTQKQKLEEFTQNKISTTPIIDQIRLNYDHRSFDPTKHLSYMTSGLVPYYSSIIQQIDLQNELLQNIINENLRIKQRMMYFWLNDNTNRITNQLGGFQNSYQNQLICNSNMSQLQQNFQYKQQINNKQSQKWNKWSQTICLKRQQ